MNRKKFQSSSFFIAIILISLVGCINPFDNKAPDEVADLSLSAGESTITLTWSDPDNPDFSGVKIFYGDTSQFIEKGSFEICISGLKNSIEYEFRVCTTDKKGNVSQGIMIKGTPLIEIGKYTGKYNFRTIQTNLSVDLGQTPPVATQFADTQYYSGSVEKVDFNRLKVIHKGSVNPDKWYNDSTLKDGLVYITVADSLILTHPDYRDLGLDYFEGQIVGENSLWFRYGAHLGHAGNFEISVDGKREEN